MFRAIGTVLRICTFVSFLMAIPLMMRMGELGKSLAKGASDPEHMLANQLKPGSDALGGAVGSDGIGARPEMRILQTILGLGKKSSDEPAAVTPSEPPKPAMLIQYVGGRPKKLGESRQKTRTVHLTGGATATVVDGMLQIYCPTGNTIKKMCGVGPDS